MIDLSGRTITRGGSTRRRSIERSTRRVHGRSPLCFAFLVALLGGCAPPDRPTILTLAAPDDLLHWLQPDSVRSVELHPGVVYRYFWTSRGPWAVHLVQAAARSRCDLGFRVLQASGREDGDGGRERVSSMAADAGQPVLAAINADFFTADGQTVGAEVVRGRVSAVAGRPTFAWKSGAEPWLGVARPEGEFLALGWAVPLDGGDGRTEAVGGFPDLIDAGHRVGDLEVTSRPSFAAARHPRSAIRYDSSSGHVWLVLVGGRQHPHPAGMTLPELAELFEALGTDEAINLDGGGSSSLVLQGMPVNRPSDATGERAVVNALALVTNAGQCTTP